MARSTTAGRAAIILAAALSLAACGGGGEDPGDDGAATSAPAPEQAATSADAPTTEAPDDGETDATDATDDATEDETTEDCNDLSPADISAAAGGVAFDTVDDVSVDADSSCLFGAATQVYGVTVSEESTETFLAGDLVGLGAAETNAVLEQLHTMTLSNAQAAPLTVAGGEGVLITGEAMTGGATATAAVVVGGEVVQVTASGEALGDLAAVVTAVLETAVSG